MPEETERVQLVKAVFAGLERMLVVLASVVTIWIQVGNSSKIDLAAQTAASTNAITTKWWAGRTGDPVDMAKAEAAEERLEKVAEKKL